MSSQKATALSDSEVSVAGKQITPYMHELVRDLLQQRSLLFDMSQLHQGPVHLLLPQIMDENISRMQDFFAGYDFDTTIHYTMKPNKSDVFARQAHKNGINIDVSSLNELKAALGAGFRGEQIGCTNTKNRQYLWLALQHGCLISADNQLELEWIAQMTQQKRHLEEPVRILLRISDLKPLDRQFKSKASKFGISVAELPDIYELLRDNPALVLEGFHFHNDNRLGDLQAGFLEHVLRLMEDAHAEGFEPTIINIGGGMRDRLLEDKTEWEAYLEHIEKSLISGADTKTWHGNAYGMHINERGRISGREKIQGKVTPPVFTDFLKEMFENDLLRDRPLSEIIAENMFSVMLEPGSALLQQCGVTLLPVKGVKMASDNSALVMVDASTYNISIYNMEPLIDPVLIPRSETQENNPFSGYLIDNVCSERGLLYKRQVAFPNEPKEGDLLCIINSAAYVSDFEDSSPHRHPQGQKFVMHKDQDQWSVYGEDNYWPELFE